ncbi:MAG: orotidine-5'-phosphate decarboxylase, partial [Gemmatimonadetes bacterium]|nr:orotidine-5'-phosphate decarboxylase [Gemmatimonadota bacterium]
MHGDDVKTPIPIIALDVPNAAAAFALLERVGPAADFVKVGLQLFTAEGPSVVRALRERGMRVFLDLKLHDIPNTVAHAVKSAARLDVDLLTLHASGGEAMLRAAADAAAGARLDLLAVTVLTSLDAAALATAWGREAVAAEAEVGRLAAMANGCGIGGIVASVHEIAAARHAAGEGLRFLAPGIRPAG